jgi:hypothetical protein
MGRGLKPNIWIRQMTWATRYGIWLGKRREQDRIIDIIKRYKYKPGFTYENLEYMIQKDNETVVLLTKEEQK